MARLIEQRKDLLTSMMKEAIYEAAVAVMTRYGMDGTTMDRVAEQAEVAKGSLYNYFPSKLELLHFVHDKTIEPMEQRGQEILAADLPAVGKLQSLIRTWFEYVDQHRGLFAFLFEDYAVRALLKPQEETAHASAIRDLSGIIEQGIEEGSFRRVDPQRAGELLFGALRQLGEEQLATDGAWPVGELTDNLIDFFLHGVEAGR